MFEPNFDSRLILIYLAVLYKGDFQQVVTHMLNKDYDVSYSKAMRVYNSLKCKVMTILDYDYPEKLRKMPHAPVVIFYYGDITLLDKNVVAVVGSRDYSEYGKAATENIIKDIAKETVIISGLARGIDAIAHQAAIDNGGRTIAVLGCGIDRCYPSENQPLYDEIKKNHLIISEYPFRVTPNGEHFPMRNRIVIGLADAVYVPQINEYASGTMISVTIAANLNKDVFVAPYPQGSETINNQMINEGALLVESGRQILEEEKWLKK